MPSVFHYSTNAGAFGIISSQCLWATHYNYLNDFRELQMLNDIMLPILDNDFRSESESMIKRGHLNPEILKDYGESVYRIEAENLIKKAFIATDKLSPMFVTSFCGHKEDSEHWANGLLSQWRAYGSDGGCAIELDEIGLNSKLKHGDLYEAIARWAPIFKGSSFQEEAESRIVVARSRGRAAKLDPREKARSIKTRYKSGTPIPYIELFADGGNLPIKRIIVGPQKDQEKVRYALELVLEQTELDAQIDISDISYLP